jgi:peptidyl-prolyl cis-trans isomerase SurA
LSHIALSISLLLLAAPAPRVLDRVAAVVNGDPVTLSELVERAGADYRRAEEQGAGEARERARAKALQAAFDQVVAERLFAAEAKTLQVEATESQVDAAVEDIKRRNKFDDRQLEMALQEQGLTRESFRTAVKRDLEAFQILNVKVKSRVKVSDEDLKNDYQTHAKEFSGEEQVRVRHIFLACPPGAGAAEEAKVRAEGEKILARLAAGEDFAELARQRSDGPSKAEGGDLGFVKKGALKAELDKAAFALATGKVSGLVRTPTGYHILKAEDRRMGGARPFDEVKEAIRDRLTAEQIETYRTQYVAELRKEAVIDVRIPELTP